MEALEELIMLPDSMLQAAVLLADEDAEAGHLFES